MTSVNAVEHAPRLSWQTELPGRIDPRLVSLLKPDSFEAVQYGMLRHAIDRAIPTNRCRVFAVTSPIPGDGKTLTTVNLAGAIARRQDVRVLLLDADLRRPSVGNVLGRSDRHAPGLLDAISEPDGDFECYVWRLERFNVSVMTTRAQQTDTYELLTSERMSKLLEHARRHYDYVLLDSPPVLPAPDSQLLGELIDGFLVVVAAEKTPRKLLEETLTRLGPTKLLGLVFNAEQYRSSRYGKYYYGYYAGSAES